MFEHARLPEDQPPDATPLRKAPTEDRSPSIWFDPHVFLAQGEPVRVVELAPAQYFARVRTRQDVYGWVQVKYLFPVPGSVALARDGQDAPLQIRPTAEHGDGAWQQPVQVPLAGERLQVLDTDAAERWQFLRVRRANGTEGWLPAECAVFPDLPCESSASAQLYLFRHQRPPDRQPPSVTSLRCRPTEDRSAEALVSPAVVLMEGEEVELASVDPTKRWGLVRTAAGGEGWLQLAYLRPFARTFLVHERADGALATPLRVRPSAARGPGEYVEPTAHVLQKEVLLVLEVASGEPAGRDTWNFALVRTAQGVQGWIQASHLNLGAGAAMESRGLRRANTTTAVPKPPYWLNAARCDAFSDMVTAAPEMLPVFQQVMETTFRRDAAGRGYSTRDRKGLAPLGLTVASVYRVEDAGMWRRYSRAKERIRAARATQGCPPLEALAASGKAKTMVAMAGTSLEVALEEDIGECYLFHGTNPDAANSIAERGFRVDMAGRSAGIAFGPGAYFAECSSKSDEYSSNGSGVFSRLYAMLLCRVCLGSTVRVERFYHNSPEVRHLVDEEILRNRRYDSLLGDREAAAATYREFVVFDATQVYPEYVVLYHRVGELPEG